MPRNVPKQELVACLACHFDASQCAFSVAYSPYTLIWSLSLLIWLNDGKRLSHQYSRLNFTIRALLTSASPPPCRPSSNPRNNSPKMAVRLLSPSPSTACLYSMQPAPMASLTLPQTFAPSANRRATSTPTCSSRSTRSATTRCASRASIEYSATDLRRVRLRGVQGR